MLKLLVLSTYFLISLATPAPHIITIVVDDFGYRDVSFNGGNIPTPYIDSLSNDGVRLHRYYTHTVCTPSRLSLLTGKYSHLSGFGSGGVILGPGPWSLPEGTTTMPKELKNRGYAAHCVGKWHLGSTRFKDTPVGSSWGFDSFVGLLHGAGGHYSKTVAGPQGTAGAFYDYSRGFANGTFEPVLDDRHSTKCLTEEAINVIDSHSKKPNKGSDHPLFLYLAYTAGHTPLQSEPEWLEKCMHLPHSTRRDFCGLVVGADQGIEKVVEHAKKMLGDNIIVMVTSDNGGMLHVGGLNTPLRGGKNMGYEGGVRTIGFITDLSRKKSYLPKGLVYQGLLHVADWMPTFLGIVDSSKKGNYGKEVCKDHVVEKRIGYGFNQYCALFTNSSSPRNDAILVMDDTTNFVSYLKPPYKLLVGFSGDGRWNEEPSGRYLYDNPSYSEMFEEQLQTLLDYVFNTRDVSFFYHEVLHIIISRYEKRFSGKKFDFEAAGHLVLGSASSGDVLASTEIDPSIVKDSIQVFDVYADPEEKHEISKTHPKVTEDLLKSFNVHWANHPKQFDWATSCMNFDRYKMLPQSECLKRTSHLNKDMNRKAITNTIPCRFERPFIKDNDPVPCGTGNPQAVNLKGIFAEKVKYIIIGTLIVFVVIVALFIGILRYFCCAKKVASNKNKNE